jgi:phosphate starvation-inducible PhoH-like protein
MKMFLTRLGFNSKAVITGDTTQIDLPQGKKSGLIEALEVCGKIEGIGVVQFGEKDVVRHNLVQQIIRAYEEYDVAHPQRGGNSGNSTASSKQVTGTAVEATGKDPNRETQRA